eukprot:6856115-Pyramimonas_sp.AAC.1
MFLLVACMAAGACLQLRLEKCSLELGGGAGTADDHERYFPHTWRFGHFNPLSSSRRERQEDIDLSCRAFDAVG